MEKAEEVSLIAGHRNIYEDAMNRAMTEYKRRCADAEENERMKLSRAMKGIERHSEHHSKVEGRGGGEVDASNFV